MALPEPDRVSSSLKYIPQNDGSAGLATTRQRRFVGQYEAPIDFRVVMALVINAQRGHADLGGFDSVLTGVLLKRLFCLNRTCHLKIKRLRMCGR